MRRFAIIVLLMAIPIFLFACDKESEPQKHDPTLVEATVVPNLDPQPTPNQTIPLASALPVPSPTPALQESDPLPLATPDSIVNEPDETELPYIPEEIPEFLEISNEVIEYSQGKSTITLPVANISDKTAKGGLVFDVYEGNGIAPKCSLETYIEERTEKKILPGETVTLIATADMDLRDCWIRVRIDLLDPMMLVE